MEIVSRRKGDPIELIADRSKIKENMGWIPKHDNFEEIYLLALNRKDRIEVCKK